jgi:hypothetical protein
MTMRRLTSILLALALLAPAAGVAKPKKKAARRAPAAAPAAADVPSEQATPDEAPPTEEKAAPTTDASPPSEPAKTPPPRAEEAPPPPAAAPAPPPTPSVDLQKLRADYDRLRDELFRARSRAQLVEEGLWNARLGATLHWKAAPDYVIKHAEVRLDGGTIWDSGDKPVTDDRLTIAERPCKPGPHSFTVRLEVRPGTKKKGKDIDNLGYASEQTFAIVIPDGKRTTIELTGDEDGSLPEYEPRLDLELDTDSLKK